MITIYPDLESLSRAAAALVAAEVQGAVVARGHFSMALSGGGTPRRAYELLAGPPWHEQAPWDRVHVFWGDERCVPQDDPRSNAGQARQAWLDRVPIPPGQIHPMTCGPDPAGAARQYEARLRGFYKGPPPWLDLVLLGLGQDGHTASLFPGTPALVEQERWVAEVYRPEPGPHRVTLTAWFINQARVVVFLVAGADKAGVLREVISGARGPGDLPARLIQPESGDLRWLVDREAAALLTL